MKFFTSKYILNVAVMLFFVTVFLFVTYININVVFSYDEVPGDTQPVPTNGYDEVPSSLTGASPPVTGPEPLKGGGGGGGADKSTVRLKADRSGVSSGADRSGVRPKKINIDTTPIDAGGIVLFDPIQKSIEDIFNAILDIIMVFAIPIIVFFIIWAGFLYVTAGGKSEQITKATTALTYALIGGVIVLGAKVLLEVITNTINLFTT